MFNKNTRKMKMYLNTEKVRRIKNVKAHNYGQWIGVEKDLSVIESHTKYIYTTKQKNIT